MRIEVKVIFLIVYLRTLYFIAIQYIVYYNNKVFNFLKSN